MNCNAANMMLGFAETDTSVFVGWTLRYMKKYPGEYLDFYIPYLCLHTMYNYTYIYIRYAHKIQMIHV